MAETNNQVPLTDPVEQYDWKDKLMDLLQQVEKNSSTKEMKGKTDTLLKEKEGLEEELKFIEQEIEDVTKLLEEIGGTYNVDKPINSNILKLYELITKLTFSIENPSSNLQGYVAGNSFETFHFDTTKQSKQFIIDHLWKLIYSELELRKK